MHRADALGISYTKKLPRGTLTQQWGSLFLMGPMGLTCPSAPTPGHLQTKEHVTEGSTSTGSILQVPCRETCLPLLLRPVQHV